MAEEYNVQAIMDALKENEEMDPDQHDGCYELMRKTVEAYSKLQDYSALDYRDLNLVYLTSVGTWKQNVERKKNNVDESHLLFDDKEYLKSLWDEVWDKANQRQYDNREMDASGNCSIGLFGTGFFSFQRTTTAEHVRAFIHMCTDILPMTDDDEIYERAAQVLNKSFKGMQAGAASMVLHCLKPYTFPVLNSNMGRGNIFTILGVNLTKQGNIDTYIENCRRIKAFRDLNFTFKNYRIFDQTAWKLDHYLLQHKHGIFEDWEIVSEDEARLSVDKTQLQKSEILIPQDISWFFRVSHLRSGERSILIFKNNESEYDGYILRESISPVRRKLFLDESLITKLVSASDDVRIVLGFNRNDENSYDIDFCDDYWPTSEEYPVNISKEQWKRFLQEVENPYHKGCMRVLACFVDVGGIASPKTLSEKYKGHPSVYTSSVLNTSKRALDYFKIDPCPDGDTQRYYPIAFLGRNGKVINPGTYEYKMRSELLEALKEMDLSGIDLTYDEGDDEMEKAEFDHNIILYGPPGTGKTYNSVIYAVAICEGRRVEDVEQEPYAGVLVRYRKLRDEGRIAFTTFHQSYSYEEFIEGIKPKLDSESESLEYVIENGIFKDFCKRAEYMRIQPEENVFIKEHPHIWGMLLGGVGSTPIKQYCFENDEIRFGWGKIKDNDAENYLIEEDRGMKLAKHQVYDFIHSMEIGDIVLIAKSITSIDAVGVITGEYEHDESEEDYQRHRKINWLVKDVDFDMIPFLPNGRKQLSTFYLYSMDYIEMDVISQILKANNVSMAEVEHEVKPYVFIIDEINRGNISKIFGELITLIEDKKRGGATEAIEAVLPYSGELFSVPNNVYILGTMNTADRSIALMDTALRRRFEFVEMMPNSEVLERQGVGTIIVGDDELNVARMLDVINTRIEYLFDREHTIGHAFFKKLFYDASLETLADIFEKNIIPLLQEYFYEDYEKIQLVLGDNSKPDEYKFILDRTIKVKDIFNGNPDIDLPEKGYQVQKEAFLKLESYKQIGRDL